MFQQRRDEFDSVASPGNPSSTFVIAQSHWHPAALCLSQFLAAVLFGTWLWAPTRAIWDDVDAAVFHLLNGSLAWGRPWQDIWALANWRPVDVLTGLAVLCVLLTTIRRIEAERPRHGWASMGTLVLTTIVVKLVVIEVLVCAILHYQRLSPTLVFDNCWRLSQQVTWVYAKDASLWCFPGDHGFVLLMCVAYAMAFGTWRAVVATLCITLAASLPRLVSGGHWMTDIVVGSSVMTLVVAGWLLATPLHDWLASCIARSIKFVFRRRTVPVGGPITSR